MHHSPRAWTHATPSPAPLSRLAIGLCTGGLLLAALPMQTHAQEASNAKADAQARFSPKPQLTLATDRLIVKYKDNSNPAAVNSKAAAALRVAGNRQGVASKLLRRMADGSHVVQLNRHVSLQDA
ncbi:MAG: hypothetical protein ACK57J_04865, partial [Rubrivivax sp.]